MKRKKPEIKAAITLPTADDVVPSTLKQAVDLVVARLSDPDVVTFIKDSKSNPAMVHETMGRGMRNQWSLWGDSTVLVRHLSETYGITHADDISGLIFHCVWREVRGKDWEVDAYVQSCKDHWRSHGVDPKTGEKLLVTLV